MVKYKLIGKENGIYIYEYYPKGNYSKKCGIVKLDTNKKGIEVSIVAEEDCMIPLINIPFQVLNKMLLLDFLKYAR